MGFYLQKRGGTQENQGPDDSAAEVESEQVLRMSPVGPAGLVPIFPYVGVFPGTYCVVNEAQLQNEARLAGQMRFAQESADDELLQEQADELTSALLGLSGGFGMARSMFTKFGKLRKKPGPVPKEKPSKKGDLYRYAVPRYIDGLHVFSSALVKQRGTAAAKSKLREVENLLTSEGVTATLSANETVTHLYMESIWLPEAAIPNPAKFARSLAKGIRDLGIEEARVGSFRIARSGNWHGDVEVEALRAAQAEDDARAIIAHQEFRKVFPRSGEADLWRP